MVDIAQAYSEIKSLPDQALERELSGGALPGYLVLSELHDRKRLRAGSNGTPVKRPSMVEDYIGIEPTRAKFSAGGNVQGKYVKGLSNPNMAYVSMARSPEKYYGKPGEGGIASLVRPPMPVAPAGLASLAPKMPQMPGAPTNPEPLNFAAGGIVSYMNQGATRRQPITPSLQERLSEAVQAVYGPGYTAGVFSGGQPARGSGGARVGTTRHDEGHAADIYVYGPDGNKLGADQLAPLGQYWQARGYGGTGMGHRTSIHLDEHTDRARSWDYGGFTKAQQAALEAGKQGQLPQLSSYGGAASAGGQPSWDSIQNAIASIESAGSGGYGALGPLTGEDRDRAFGRYQIMGKNIGPWSKQHFGEQLTSEQFLQNQAAQDAVFRGQFGDYINKYGLEGAAQAWIGGPGSVGNVGRQDILGTSVGQYGQKFMQALGNPAADATAAAANAATAAGAAGAAGAAEAGAEVAAGGMDPLTMLSTLSKFAGGQPQAQAPVGGAAPQKPMVPYKDTEIMRTANLPRRRRAYG